MTIGQRRLVRLVTCAVIVLLLPACSSTQVAVHPASTASSAPASTSTRTSIALSTTTSMAPPQGPIAGACPPGCSLPSDHDAITWLASASNSVTIVTAYPNPQRTPEGPILFRVDRVLELTSSPWRPIPEGPFSFPAMKPGQEFLVFLSAWRGGPCVSTLYSFDPSSQSATLMAAGRHEIPLPGRELPVPQSISLAQVRARMYPTGPFVPSTDESESMCPE